MNFLHSLFNLALLLAWVRLWCTPSREFHFNPFLSSTIRLCDSVIDPLRAALRLPDKLIALIVFLIIFTLRTLTLTRLGATWTCQISPLFTFQPPAGQEAWLPIFTFSALTAIQSLLNLWGVFLIVSLITPNPLRNRAYQAFIFFARPFSSLPLLAQPLLLFLAHLLLILTLQSTQPPTTHSKNPDLHPSPRQGTISSVQYSVFRTPAYTLASSMPTAMPIQAAGLRQAACQLTQFFSSGCVAAQGSGQGALAHDADIPARTATRGTISKPCSSPHCLAKALGLPTAAASLLRIIWLAAISLANSLATLTSALFILIIGNLLTAILGIPNLMLICHEGAQMLMGRFATQSSATTGINFAPLFFFLAVNLLHATITTLLHQLINTL